MSTNTNTDTTVADTDEPVGVRRLREARELRDRLAAETTPAPVVDPNMRVLQVGETFHAVDTGLTIPRTTSLWGGDPSIVTTRGESYVFTAAMREAAVDRFGAPGWPALVHDPEAQRRAWGRIHLAPGPAPEGTEPWIYGDARWSHEREVARANAHAQPDEESRAAALREVHRRFGPAPTTSAVLNSAPDPSIAAANAQAERIAQRGAVVHPTYAPGERGGGER